MAILRILVYGLVLGFFYLILRIVLKGLALPRNPDSDDEFRTGDSRLPHYRSRGNMLDIAGEYRRRREKMEPGMSRWECCFITVALSMIWIAFLCFVYFQMDLPKSLFWRASVILSVFFLLILTSAPSGAGVLQESWSDAGDSREYRDRV